MRDYRLASVLMVLSIWPSMVNFVSAQANVATEDLSTNLPASVISTLVFFIAIAATVVFKWGVIGVGASMLLHASGRFSGAALPDHEAHPRLGQRPCSSCGIAQTHDDLCLAERHQHDSGADRVGPVGGLPAEASLLGYPPGRVLFGGIQHGRTAADQLTVFGSAASATIFAQYGRDKSKTSRHHGFLIPLSCADVHSAAFHRRGSRGSGLASSLRQSVQRRGHGCDAGSAAVHAQSLHRPVQSLLQSAERQGYVILATVLAGIVDIGVAWYLIPAHGAVGACIGSGAAQVMAVGMMWAVGIHLYKVKLPWLLVAKIAFISVLASLTAHYIAVQLSPLWAILSAEALR